MERYSNTSPLTGKASGVRGYDYGNDFITVYFSSGAAYTYTVGSCGSGNIATMKRLANQQSGLNTFLTKQRPPYTSKR